MDWGSKRSPSRIRSKVFHCQVGSFVNVHLKKPFLIYLKKRDAQQPFFVMWVDNAEMLAPK